MSDKIIKRIIGIVVLAMVVLVSLPLVLRMLNNSAAESTSENGFNNNAMQQVSSQAVNLPGQSQAQVQGQAVAAASQVPAQTQTQVQIPANPGTKPSDVQIQLALSANEQQAAQADISSNPSQVPGGQGTDNSINNTNVNNQPVANAAVPVNQLNGTANVPQANTNANVNSNTNSNTLPLNAPGQAQAMPPADTIQNPNMPANSVQNNNSMNQAGDQKNINYTNKNSMHTATSATTLSSQTPAQATSASANPITDATVNTSAAAAKMTSVAPASAKGASKTKYAKGEWVLQLGAFSNTGNAHKLAKQLQMKGYPAYTKASSTIAGSMTRVLVGPVAQQQAQKIKLELAEQLNLNGVIKRSVE